eukprot:SM000061S19220  [mRNA]  locus=s61:258098:260745:+ [translate_table: standard]
MARELAEHALPPPGAPRTPAAVFAAMDHYLYVYQGFKRSSPLAQSDARNYYLDGCSSSFLPLLGSMTPLWRTNLLPAQPSHKAGEQTLEQTHQCKSTKASARCGGGGGGIVQVLTRRVGTSVMLALIYSELASRLLKAGAIDFAVDLELPLDVTSLPRARVAAIGLAGGAAVAAVAADRESLPGAGPSPTLVFTPTLLLCEVLRGLKELYWPWRYSRSTSGGTGFLEAAEACTRGEAMGLMGPATGPSTSSCTTSPAEIAAARSAGHRLQRGIWTSIGFGDMRRSVAATERLVIMGTDERDSRDLGVLLFHCGLYQPAHAYLKAYAASQATKAPTALMRSNALHTREMESLERLLSRLQLLLAEQAWQAPAAPPLLKEPLPEPW